MCWRCVQDSSANIITLSTMTRWEKSGEKVYSEMLFLPLTLLCHRRKTLARLTKSLLKLEELTYYIRMVILLKVNLFLLKAFNRLLSRLKTKLFSALKASIRLSSKSAMWKKEILKFVQLVKASADLTEQKLLSGDQAGFDHQLNYM